MLTRHRRQIHHDRYRIALATILTLAAGHFGEGPLPVPLPLALEIPFTLALLALIPVVSAKFGSRRHWIEIIATGNLIVTLSAQLSPVGLFAGHGMTVMVALQIPAVAGLLLGLRQLIYGQWSDRFARCRPYRVETTLRTRLPLEELWFAMVPTPGFADRNPDSEVVSVEFADVSKTVVRLTTWVPSRAGTGEVLLDFDEITALKHARFRRKVTRGRHDPCADGETEMVFEDRVRHRILHLRHTGAGVTPRRALLAKFDDTYGRKMTARLEAIETRAATGRARRARVTGAAANGWFESCGSGAAGADAGNQGYRTAFDRPPSTAETEALQALGRI